MLRAEHITKQYSLPDSGHTVFDAVSDVSLELKDGCVSSLVGESGSGKSTLALFLEELFKSLNASCTFQTIGMDGFHFYNDYLKKHDLLFGKHTLLIVLSNDS